jgi:hypothetical protein
MEFNLNDLNQTMLIWVRIWIKFLNQSLKFVFDSNIQMGLGPLAQPSPPGWLTLTGSGMGRSNWPSPHCSLSLSSPLSPELLSGENPNRPAVAWWSRPTPASSATATLGELLSFAPSSIPTKWFRRPPPLRGDPWLDPAREFASQTPLNSTPRRLLPGACGASPRWSWCVCARRWKRRGAVLLVCLVKSSPSSLWPAARALPRHAVQTSAWAYGERILPPLYPSILFSGHGLWSSGRDQWAKLTGIALCCCYLMLICEMDWFG